MNIYKCTFHIYVSNAQNEFQTSEDLLLVIDIHDVDEGDFSGSEKFMIIIPR